MGLLNVLSCYVCEASYDHLPQAVISSTKDRILDFLGAAFSGYERNIHKPIFEAFQMRGGNNESTVIGEGVKLPCNFAALINSSMCLDLADGSRFAGLHTSTTVIPAALAVSEAEIKTMPTGGKSLILAIALGYEVMIRVGKAINPSALKRGFHLTGIVGPLGSAAATGKIINLDETSMLNALALASTLGSGLAEAFKSPPPFTEIPVARACEAGIVCALLAQTGVKGNDMILEEGFIPAFSDEYRLDLIEKGLGEDYMLPKTYIKMHGGCRHIHAPVDCALRIINEHDICLEEIEQVRVQTYSVAFDLEIDSPKTSDDAKWSIPFGISVGLIHGNVSIDKFTDKYLRSEQIQELMRRVRVERNTELDKDYPDKRGVIVEIVAKGGRTFSDKLDFANGEPEYPFSRLEIEDKFKYLTSRVISEETRQKIINFVIEIETVEEVSGLFAWLKCQPLD